MVCKAKARHATETTNLDGLSHTASLHIGRKLFGGVFSLDATHFDPSEVAGGLLHQVEFWATFSKVRHGLSTFVSVRANGDGDPDAFTVSGPSGEPSEATLAPPAPFAGSATFKLESPTVASWTGDLRMRMPILGNVSLTAPSFWEALCEGTHCTETLPPGVHLGFFTVSFLE